jgi:hypothetical protein
VELPELWRLHGVGRARQTSVSNDGTRLALTGDGIFGSLPLDMPSKERSKAKRRGSRLGIVNLVEHTAVAAAGSLEGSGWGPVWSADDQFVFVGAPFGSELLVCGAEALALTPVAISNARRAPMPLLDLRAAT